MTDSEATNNQCIDVWRRLHKDNAYFKNHPHYIDQRMDLDGVFAGAIQKHVRLTHRDDVLEIGCGYGRLMAGIAPLVRTISGIDVDIGLVKYANERLSGFPNATAYACDGVSIPFDGDKFSLVYSTSAFQHMPRDVVGKYIGEAHRVLTGGGWLWAEFWSGGDSRLDINPNLVREQSASWTIDQILSAGTACFGAHESLFVIDSESSPSAVLMAQKSLLDTQQQL